MSKNTTSLIEAQAAEWLVRRESDAWNGDDQARLLVWLGACDLNRVAFLRLELAWEEAGRLKALGAGVQSDGPPAPGDWNLTPFFPPSTRLVATNHSEGPAPQSLSVDPGAPAAPSRPARVGRRKLFLYAAAAGVLAAILGVLQWYSPVLRAGDRYTTQIGALESVPITDGSQIILNTNSQIRVSLSNTERHIDLAQGEAYFEVAHDPSRPFVVETAHKRIIAVGTKFSVRRESDGVQVIVTEGQVRVENTLDSQRSAGAPGDAAPVLLTPGSIARATDTGVIVQRTTLPEAEAKLSWRSGVLMFREQTLANAVAEFNRYNARQIEIDDPAIANLTIEGNFRATNSEAFAHLLGAAFPVQVREDGHRIVLTRR